MVFPTLVLILVIHLFGPAQYCCKCRRIVSRRQAATVKHWWFSGRILACHAGDRGSIPRQCTFLFPSKFDRALNKTRQGWMTGLEKSKIGITHSALRQGWRQEFSDEGAEMWFLGYYKCQKSPKKSCFTFRRGHSLVFSLKIFTHEIKPFSNYYTNLTILNLKN